MKLVMYEDNICTFTNALSKQWCDEVIAIADEKIGLAETTRDSDNCDIDGIMFRDCPKRIDSSLNMDTFGSLSAYENQLLKVLEICWKKYGNSKTVDGINMFPRWKEIEKISCKIQRTPPGGGFSVWHYEQGPDKYTSRRFAVWILYLNDVNKGGKTDFPNQNISLTPRAGTLVIWPAAYTHPHRSGPELEEFKYIITGWFVYHVGKYPAEKSRT